MKKKCLAALTVAMMLAAMPVVSYAAGSSSYSHGSSSSSNSSSSSTSKSEAGTASGATVTVTTPTVQVTESGAKVTVATATKDATGTTVGLVGSTTENGKLKNGAAYLSVAVGTAETAGLPEGVVNTIKDLNDASKSLSAALPGLGLEGFAKVGGTRAIVAKNAANQDVKTDVSLYVDKMPANVANLVIICYDNTTGKWTTIKDVKIDAATKTVSFTVPASCTIQIAVK